MPIDKCIVYKEICSAYRKLDDFRTKLLGFLPLTSGVGVFAILKDAQQSPSLAALGLLGAIVTLGLGLHEIRTILRCRALIRAGRLLEKELCLEKDATLFASYPDKSKHLYPLLSTATASFVIYAGTFTAWLYVYCKASQ